MPMLEVRDLTVRYGALEAIRNVSFSVDAGEIVALIGSNGAGKSTTLRATMGLTPPAAGSIYLDGQDITTLNSAVRVRNGIALSPEGRRLFGRMTVLDNLLTGAYSVKSRAVQQQILEEIYDLFPRIKERRCQLAGSLSGGEQQMVAIGRALMAN